MLLHSFYDYYLFYGYFMLQMRFTQAQEIAKIRIYKLIDYADFMTDLNNLIFIYFEFTLLV